MGLRKRHFLCVALLALLCVYPITCYNCDCEVTDTGEYKCSCDAEEEETKPTGSDISSPTPSIPEKLYDVTESDLETLHAVGHLHLRGVLPLDIVKWAGPLIDETVEKYAHVHSSFDKEYNPLHGDPKVAEEHIVHQFIRIFDLWEKAPALKQLSLSKGLGRLGADLLKVDAVRLYQDQSFYKRPSHAETKFHDDLVSCPLATDKFISMWIPLHDMPASMGTLQYADRSHRVDLISDELYAAPWVRFRPDVVHAMYNVTTAPDVTAGDILIHLGHTLHGAGSNEGNVTRRALTIQYFEDGTAFASEDAWEQLDPSDKPSLERWVYDQEFERVVDDPHVPLVYQRAES